MRREDVTSVINACDAGREGELIFRSVYHLAGCSKTMNRLAFSDDSSYYLLCSLEVLDDDGNMERKADMFNKRTIRQAQVVTSVDTASEALAVSIAERARVDMPYMAQLKEMSALEVCIVSIITLIIGFLWGRHDRR